DLDPDERFLRSRVPPVVWHAGGGNQLDPRLCAGLPAREPKPNPTAEDGEPFLDGRVEGVPHHRAARPNVQISDQQSAAGPRGADPGHPTLACHRVLEDIASLGHITSRIVVSQLRSGTGPRRHMSSYLRRVRRRYSWTCACVSAAVHTSSAAWSSRSL